VATPPEHAPEGARAAPSAGARFYDGLAYLGGLILAIMTGAVFLQVVLRYLGLVGIDGLEEVPRFLFVWLIMIGAAAAMWRHEHTILDYFLNRFGPIGRSLISIVTNGLGVALFAYLIYISFTLVPNAGLQTSAGLGLTLDWVFLSMPVGSVLIIAPMLRNIYFDAMRLWRKLS
jgi:TRAP-type C4-dicarboxylate transport system permease small subunit